MNAGDVSFSVSSARIINKTVAGQTTVDSSVVDMTDHRAARFTLDMGAVTSGAATSAKLQHGDEADGSDMEDIEGSSITIADTHDNKRFIWELMNPSKPYARLRVLRATQDSEVDSAGCDRFKAKKSPVDDGASVQERKILREPVTGTA